MSNPQYLAQVGHFLAGYGLIATALIFSLALEAGWTPILITLGIGVTVASLKEFVYDTNKTWGEGDSWADSLMDWAFYMLGGAVGMGIAGLSHSMATFWQT
jgi:hypothetical protein